LAEVCPTIQDGAHESPKRQFDAPGDGRFLYITSKNIRMNNLNLGDVSYVERDFHDRIYPRCQPRVGDVLLTKDGASTGNVTLNTLDEEFSLLSSVCLIKTDPAALYPAFLCYYLQSPDGLRGIVGRMTGAAIKRIILQNVKLATIPLPPLEEQRRIIGMLDEAFKAIASARANAEQNLRNAQAVFESRISATFSQREERSGSWELRSLGDLFDITSSKRVFEADWRREGVPFYRAREIVKLARDGFVNNELFISEEMYDRYSAKHGIPTTGDIMVTGVGTLGICYVVKATDRFYFKDGNIIWLKKISDVESRFVAYAFRSEFLRKQIDDSVGATVGTYTIIKAKGTVIPVPPLPEQERIVEHLDRVAVETRHLASVYRRKLDALDGLKQSLLHQAFSGAL